MFQTGIVKETHYSEQKAEIKSPIKGITPKQIYRGNDELLSAAEVEITRSSSCGDNCASCGLCPGQTSRVFAINDANAAVGDEVMIEMSDKKVLGAAFLVYIVPIITLIIGYFISHAIFNSEALAILTGFLFMVITLIVIMRIDRKNKRRYTPRIVRVITEDKTL